MVKFVIFDTETTGLPKFSKKDAVLEKNNWPDIVSLSYVVYDISNGKKLIKKIDNIVKPQGWVIPEESVQFHNITQEYAMENGKDLYDVLANFINDIQDAKLIIAHNLRFDKNVVFNAMKWRLDIDPTHMWPQNAEFCSFEQYKSEVGHTRKKLNLNAMYEDTFKKPAPLNAHNSMRDVEVLDEIFWERWTNTSMV
jgi:DNA polymerase III epsilon subunit-like protein